MKSMSDTPDKFNLPRCTVYRKVWFFLQFSNQVWKVTWLDVNTYLTPVSAHVESLFLQKVQSNQARQMALNGCYCLRENRCANSFGLVFKQLLEKGDMCCAPFHYMGKNIQIVQ